MDLSKQPAPPAYPLTFKGHLATSVLHADRVEFRRRWAARLGGNRSGTVLLADVLKIDAVAPTGWVNGYVHLITAADSGRLRAASRLPQEAVAGNPRTIMFSYGQRDTYTKFVAAVEAAWRALGSGL